VPDGDRTRAWSRREPLGVRVRLPRPTIRLRLTLLYGTLFLVSGAILLGVTYVLVSSATGNPLVYQSPDGQLTVTFAREPDAAGSVPEESPSVVVQGIPAPAGVGPEEGTEQLQALAEQQQAAQMYQLLIWSGVALAIMAVVSVGCGWLAAGWVLRPVRAMTVNVRQISATNLEQRLGLDGPNDELKDLGNTFNDLLGRLERSFDAQRQFVANASHELRTPLARQRTLIQVALDDPEASAGSLRATIERVLVAGDEQEQLVEALLTLARGERGLERHELVDLAAVTDGVLRSRPADLGDHALRLDAQLDAARVSGDPSLLQRLVTNLVDNAVRYNTPQGWIEVGTGTNAGSAVLRVTNDGPIVPPADVDRLFEPFQRMGADRTQRGHGWGLGLSIVRAIVGAHDAAILTRVRPTGGLEIEVSFPAPSKAAEMVTGATPIAT